jgi:hypothetical protein
VKGFKMLFTLRLGGAPHLHRPLQPRAPSPRLALLPPDSTSADPQPSGREIKPRDRLGGLIHEYHRAAA